MGSLRDAKTYGGIGSILPLVAFLIPSFGWVLSIVGFILVLLAVKYISEAVHDNVIFTYVLYAVIAGILAVLVIGFVVAAALALALAGITAGVSADFLGLVVGAIAGLAAVWVLAIVGAYFLRKAFGRIATSLNVGLFKTTGLLYLIGAATTIVLVGFIILFVALILQIVCFFSIPEQPAAGPAPPAPVQPLMTT
jgi:uncharacterized membrane protein